jgi:succinate dehydrogenase/fumarate reductase cytochrome b subunit
MSFPFKTSLARQWTIIGMKPSAIHRSAATVVAMFLAMHMANHLAGLAGVAAHLRFMEAARAIYRQPLVETVLLLAVATQAASGLWLVRAGWKTRSGVIAWLQAASGAYLALFLLIHVAAVLFGRAVSGLDTNFHFAAAGLHVPPFHYFFAPYYFLAVLALFTHLGCALAWRLAPAPRARALTVALALGLGAVVSSLVLAALMGKLYPYEVPQVYKSTFLPAAAHQ